MKKQEQKNKTVFHAVAALLAVLAVVLVLYGGGRWLEKRAEKPETRTQLPQADQETVEVDGVTYRKKSRLTTILVMGVDHDTQDSYEYRKAGQADFLRLVVLDDADKTVQQLQIDRDTITPVTVLGLLGDRYEPVTQQICLGYAFGDGRQTSCEVTVEAVENLLGGQTIDQYLAMGLDGISTLNDLAGGVTVTLEDDFSAIDPAMTKGATLTLQGEQAETYVRSRRSIGVGTNEARMARQESYIRQLSVQLELCRGRLRRPAALPDHQHGQRSAGERGLGGKGLHPAGHHQTGWHLSGRGGWLHGVLPGGCQPAAGGAAAVLRKS